MYEMIEADNAWDMSQARMLYEAKIPEDEKKPFILFIDKRKIDKLEVKVFKDEKGLFAGFVVALVYADILLIDYFAVADDYKEKGLEAEALEKIKEILPGARVVLVCSERDEEMPGFFEEAGYKKADYRIRLGDIEQVDVKQDIYISADEIDYVSFDELTRVYENVYGALIAGAVSRI